MNDQHPRPGSAAAAQALSQRTIIKPYCLSELAGMYGVCPKTFGKWLHPFQRELGDRVGRYYSSLQVEIILQRLGSPYRVWEE